MSYGDANRSVYTWDGNVNEFTRTASDAVKNAITTGFKPDSCPFQNLGEEFGNGWKRWMLFPLTSWGIRVIKMRCGRELIKNNDTIYLNE